MFNTTKEPLYRKVNTKARGCSHIKGSNFRYVRNKKNPDEGMKQGVSRGLDYTPLFRFLLSKVGEDFDHVHSEAISRLDRKDPIYWMVKTDRNRKFDWQVSDISGCSEGKFRFGNAFFNTLYVDSDNKLQKVDPSITVNDITPNCDCCTHTFNGKPVPIRKENDNERV